LQNIYYLQESNCKFHIRPLLCI